MASCGIPVQLAGLGSHGIVCHYGATRDPFLHRRTCSATYGEFSQPGFHSVDSYYDPATKFQRLGAAARVKKHYYSRPSHVSTFETFQSQSLGSPTLLRGAGSQRESWPNGVDPGLQYRRISIPGRSCRPSVCAKSGNGAAAAPLPSGSSEMVPGGVLEKVISAVAAISTWPPTMQEIKRRQVAGIDQSNLKDPRELADADGQFIRFRGVDIHYKQAEPFLLLSDDESEILGEDGTTMIGLPAVLLHGFGASLFSWERVLRPIASLLGAAAIAFDRPAFGLTSRMKPPGGGRWGTSPPERNPYTGEFSAAAALAFANMLVERDRPSGKPAILIAHSAGSPIAIQAALQSPEKIAALILVAPAVFAPILQDQNFPASQEPYAREQQQEEAKFQAELEGSTKEQRQRGNPLAMALKTFVAILTAAFTLVIGKLGLALLWIAARIRAAGRNIQQGVEDLGTQVHDWLEARAGGEVADTAREVGIFVWGLEKWAVAHMLLAAFWVAQDFGQFLKETWNEAGFAASALWASGLRSEIGLWMMRQAIGRAGVTAVKFAWHDPSGCTQRVLDAYTKPIMCRDWDRALLEFIVANSSPGSASIAERLHEVKCPVLIVTGDDDRLVPAWNSRRLAGAFPRARFRIIPKCGHLPQEEKPVELLAIIREFIRHEILHIGSTNGTAAYLQS